MVPQENDYFVCVVLIIATISIILIVYMENISNKKRIIKLRHQYEKYNGPKIKEILVAGPHTFLETYPSTYDEYTSINNEKLFTIVNSLPKGCYNVKDLDNFYYE